MDAFSYFVITGIYCVITKYAQVVCDSFLGCSETLAQKKARSLRAFSNLVSADAYARLGSMPLHASTRP